MKYKLRQNIRLPFQLPFHSIVCLTSLFHQVFQQPTTPMGYAHQGQQQGPLPMAGFPNQGHMVPQVPPPPPAQSQAPPPPVHGDKYVPKFVKKAADPATETTPKAKGQKRKAAEPAEDSTAGARKAHKTSGDSMHNCDTLYKVPVIEKNDYLKGVSAIEFNDDQLNIMSNEDKTET